MNANSHPIKVVSVAGSGTDEMVVNSHPIKVVEVADEGIYANDHPYKVIIEGPYRSIWLTALPNKTSGGARKLIDGGE